MLYTVEGIVIRSMDYGEGNKIITIYTKEAGKAAVMVRGAKKTQSRHAAVSQLFTYGHFIYYKSRSGQMGTLNSGEIIDSRHLLRENLQMTGYAAYLAELTDRIIGDEEGSAFLFGQLTAAYEAIEQGKEPRIISHIYELKMLEIAGYAPVLHECVNCGLPFNPSAAAQGEMAAALSVRMGGALCNRCKNQDMHAFALQAGIHKLLWMLQKVDLRKLGKTEMKSTTLNQIKQCLRAFYDTYLGVQWKSRNFLDQMEKYEF